MAKVWDPEGWLEGAKEIGKRVERGNLEESTETYEEKQRLQNPAQRRMEAERLRREGQMSAAAKMAEENPSGMVQQTGAGMGGQSAGQAGGGQSAVPMGALMAGMQAAGPAPEEMPNVRPAPRMGPPPMPGQMGQLAPSPAGPTPSQPATPLRTAPAPIQMTPAEQLRRRQMRML